MQTFPVAYNNFAATLTVLISNLASVAICCAHIPINRCHISTVRLVKRLTDWSSVVNIILYFLRWCHRPIPFRYVRKVAPNMILRLFGSARGINDNDINHKQRFRLKPFSFICLFCSNVQLTNSPKITSIRFYSLGLHFHTLTLVLQHYERVDW